MTRQKRNTPTPEKPQADFGAGLDPTRARMIGAFLDTKGTDNTETLANMRNWFAQTAAEKALADAMLQSPLVVERRRLLNILEDDVVFQDGQTGLERLVAMPQNEDQTWSGGGRPANLGWALDDIGTALAALGVPEQDAAEAIMAGRIPHVKVEICDMTFQPDQTVYLPDGREAIYVMQNGEQHLVRVLREVDDIESGAYTYPDDRITTAMKVYAAAPVDVWDKQVLAKREQVQELDRELRTARQEIADAAKNKAAMEKAAAKYPDISDALDFIEGRITHVVQWSGYGGVVVLPVKDALEDRETAYGRVRVNGMKLLCLFGTDTAGKRQWKVNAYRDGSGSGGTTIWPARSEGEARDKVRGMVNEALTAWRAGDEKWWHGHIGVADTFKVNPWLEVPDDWRARTVEAAAQQRQQKLDKLRAKIAELENES